MSGPDGTTAITRWIQAKASMISESVDAELDTHTDSHVSPRRSLHV